MNFQKPFGWTVFKIPCRLRNPFQIAVPYLFQLFTCWVVTKLLLGSQFPSDPVKLTKFCDSVQKMYHTYRRITFNTIIIIQAYLRWCLSCTVWFLHCRKGRKEFSNNWRFCCATNSFIATLFPSWLLKQNNKPFYKHLLLLVIAFSGTLYLETFYWQVCSDLLASLNGGGTQGVLGKFQVNKGRCCFCSIFSRVLPRRISVWLSSQIRILIILLATVSVNWVEDVYEPFWFYWTFNGLQWKKKKRAAASFS